MLLNDWEIHFSGRKRSTSVTERPPRPGWDIIVEFLAARARSVGLFPFDLYRSNRVLHYTSHRPFFFNAFFLHLQPKHPYFLSCLSCVSDCSFPVFEVLLHASTACSHEFSKRILYGAVACSLPSGRSGHETKGYISVFGRFFDGVE